MKLRSGEFVPLLVHSAMEPGASVSMPEEILRHCESHGFPGAGILEESRFLGLQRMVARLAEFGPPPDRFRPLAACELDVRLKGQGALSAVLIARTKRGWGEVLHRATLPEDAAGRLAADLNMLQPFSQDFVLLLRGCDPSLSIEGLASCKAVLPRSYLALGRPSPAMEAMAMEAGLAAVAAPDCHCFSLHDEKFLKVWRDWHNLAPLDPAQCMVLASRYAVECRFKGALALARRTREILDDIEIFDWWVPDLPPAANIKALGRAARQGLAWKTIPSDHRPRYVARLEEELVALQEAGLVDQILAASGLIAEARTQKVPFALGHGELTGLLTAWALGITAIDPVRHDLPFHRFLRVAPERVPTVRLTLGTSAGSVMDAYVRQTREVTHLAHQVISLTPTECAQKVSREMNLSLEEGNFLQTQANSATVDPIGTAPTQILAESTRLRLALKATGRLQSLPWRLCSHPTGLVVHPDEVYESPDERGKRHALIAPVEWEGSSYCGYLPIEVCVDSALDVRAATFAQLDSAKQEEYLRNLALRNHSAALSRVIRGMERKAPFYRDRFNYRAWVSGSSGGPASFEDLVILYAFLQLPVAQFQQVRTIFSSRKRSTAALYQHPEYKAIVCGTRETLLFEEDAEVAMTRILGMAQQDVDDCFNNQDRIYGWNRFHDQRIRAARIAVDNAAHRENKSPVAALSSSQRKAMYTRDPDQIPPSASYYVVDSVSGAVARVLEAPRYKIQALISAIEAYEDALLDIALGESAQAKPPSTLEQSWVATRKA